MVTPYLTQHSPPALVAMLPPMLQISNEEGSGGYHRSCWATAFFTSALNSPGWHGGGASNGVDRDVAHLLRRQHDAVVDGGSPAGQPAARSARHDGTRCALARA